MESVTWYKLNQASQILFLKKALISSSVKILSVVFQEVTGSPHSFLRKISRFLMDNFDPCEHMQVSITSLQVILWRKKWDSVEEKASYFSLQLHHRRAFAGVSHLTVQQKCPMHSLMLSRRILKCVLRLGENNCELRFWLNNLYLQYTYIYIKLSKLKQTQ